MKKRLLAIAATTAAVSPALAQDEGTTTIDVNTILTFAIAGIALFFVLPWVWRWFRGGD